MIKAVQSIKKVVEFRNIFSSVEIMFKKSDQSVKI
jgi:hypothetical protein